MQPGHVGTLQVGRVEIIWKELSAQNKSEGVVHDDVEADHLSMPHTGTRVVTATAAVLHVLVLYAVLYTRLLCKYHFRERIGPLTHPEYTQTDTHSYAKTPR